MNNLSIVLEKKQLMPNEAIEFVVDWNLTNVDDLSLEIHLFWHTEGRGNEDLEIYESIPFVVQSAIGKKSFRMIAPCQPYSFSGKLISLIWKLEVVSPSTKLSCCEVLQISPTESSILL